ncbi:MAG: alanyl-tRNA editing protein [Alphaproteobacteria bacterium]|nr:alanyl-tRNA editing protein [Alphaproteobacteria bacterium]
MSTKKVYLAEPQTLSGEATVVDLINGERLIVRLDKTWFHAQGGGQKGDKGRIGSVVVLDARHAEEGEVDHFVNSFDGLSVGQVCSLSVDAASRRVNAVYHSAGHLLAAVAEKEFPEIKAVQGHHWPGEARVEFEGSFSPEFAGRLSSSLPLALKKAISEQWPVHVLGNPYADRSVQFGSAAPIPCGGTHVAHLGQIKEIVIKAIKKKGARLRVSYEAEANGVAF